jgi:hypothetical protein
MSEQRVTDLQNLGERPADNDVVHIVDVSDTSQNPAGSSKKVTAGEMREGLATDADIADFETTTQLNARDAANRSRANHTGAQAISTVTNLQNELDGKVQSVVAGTNVTVDATDPANPIVSATGELSGSGITVSETAPEDPEEGDFWLDTGTELPLDPEGGQTEEFDNGNSGTTVTVDWNNGRHQKLTLTDDCVVTFVDPQFVGRYDVRIIQGGAGEFDITSIPGIFPDGQPQWNQGETGDEILLTVRFDGNNYINATTGYYTPS